MASRLITDLDPKIQPLCREHVSRCKREGIDLLITCTYRSNAEQAELYASGRTKPGPWKTNKKPGQSKHNLTGKDGKPAAMAYDIVPLRGGKTLVWGLKGNGLDDDPTDDDTDDLELWQRVGKIATDIGLVWGGNWPKRDCPHFEL